MQSESKDRNENKGGNILFLFAPAFSAFGCDVARELLRRRGGEQIFGLHTGSGRVANIVTKNLGNLLGNLWGLEKEEACWISTVVTEDDLNAFDRKYGPGTFGRTIVADRRVGRGFVRGGLTRPDRLGDFSVAHPVIGPQRYIVGLYNFLEHIYDEIQPELVFCYAVAGAPAVAMAELCKMRGISFFRLTHTRIGNRFMVDDDAAGHLAPAARRFQEALESKKNLGEFADQASSYLKKFRESPQPPEYQIRNQAKVTAHSVSRATWRLARNSFSEVTHFLLGRNRHSWINIKRDYFNWCCSFRKARKNTNFSPIESVSGPFLYFPLHVDPEASTMVLSPWHTDQLSIIESLAKSIPARLSMVVKEHRPMLGMRPPGFYEKIAKMPRVTLIGPEHSGLDLIRRSAVTAAITGTAAWEAMCLGTPALVIGDSPYLVIGKGVVHEPCLAGLPEAISAALDLAPIPDSILEVYIGALLAESFEMSSSILWGNYKMHQLIYRDQAVQSIVTTVIERMRRYAPVC